MVGATLELYSHVLAALPPTPSRFHYLFNPRDLGRVLEGPAAVHARPVCHAGGAGAAVAQ